MSTSRPKRTNASSSAPKKQLRHLTDTRKASYCLTDDETIDKKLLMLAAANVVDNLHDFSGPRSSIKEGTLMSIIDQYTSVLEDAQKEVPIIHLDKHYKAILNAIRNISGIDTVVKEIYADYFNNTVTEPEIEWSSLRELGTIKDNFEVIIGDKKALLHLTSNNNEFLNKIREIILRNDRFKDKQINFVVDVSTIGNEPFVDQHSKICKGTASFFDDFHRPSPASITPDERYIYKEINFNVNIQNIVSSKEKCILNHLALTNFKIQDSQIIWQDKKDEEANNTIRIENTIPNEFGVTSFSSLVDVKKGVKTKINKEGRALLERFKSITGLNDSFNLPDYGRHIFDFKRLMDSSQIIYTDYLNNQKDGSVYIFVTHDNMAAIIARLLGIPYIQTHVNGFIRSISIHLGGIHRDDMIPEDTIISIKQQILGNVKKACELYKNKPLPSITYNIIGLIIKNVKDNDLDSLKTLILNYEYSNLKRMVIFRWILGAYVKFLDNAKKNLEAYINDITTKIQTLTQSLTVYNYSIFKHIKKFVLNVNYTEETLKQDVAYISTLINKLNNFVKTHNDTKDKHNLYKFFYNIINEDSGYLFSTLDFKMLVYCLITEADRKDIKVDFDTTYYANINIEPEHSFSSNSNKFSLRRYFIKIKELNSIVKKQPTPTPTPKQFYAKKQKQGGVLEVDDMDDEAKKAYLVNSFMELIRDKDDLKAYSEAINSSGGVASNMMDVIPHPIQPVTTAATRNGQLNYIPTASYPTKLNTAPSGITISTGHTKEYTPNRGVAPSGITIHTPPRRTRTRTRTGRTSIRNTINRQLNYIPTVSYPMKLNTAPSGDLGTYRELGRGGGGETQRFQFYDDFLNKIKL